MVNGIRRQFREAVAADQVKVADRWGKPCHAFNVHIEPSAAARAGLGRLQDILEEVGPSMLRCPESALHVSVAWLLAVHVDYGEPKQAIWLRHGDEWVAELGQIATEHEPFDLDYRWLVATDSAVIAVAEPITPVRGIRADIAARLSLPELTKNSAAIVHTTLFRFGSPLSQPERLLSVAESLHFSVPFRVEQLIVSEELTFPSLHTSTKALLALG